MEARFDMFGDLNYVDESVQSKYRQLGFKRGYSLGEEAGWREGYAVGVKKGATVAAEIGFYQGFVYAWINMLEKEDSAKRKKISVLQDLLNMIKSFPKVNVGSNEAKLSRIRAKFKQINTLLNLDLTAENFDFTIPSTTDHKTTSTSSAPTPHHHQQQQRSSVSARNKHQQDPIDRNLQESVASHSHEMSF